MIGYTIKFFYCNLKMVMRYTFIFMIYSFFSFEAGSHVVQIVFDFAVSDFQLLTLQSLSSDSQVLRL